MRNRLPILLAPLALGAGLLLVARGGITSGGDVAQGPAAVARDAAPAGQNQPVIDRRKAGTIPPVDGTADAARAQALLISAIRSVEGQRSISAGIRLRAELFGHQLLGSGSYLEVRQATVPLIRLELKMQVAENMTSLVEVCDGRTLWTYRKLLDSETLSYLDAVRACNALERGSAVPGRVGGAQVPGLGGLPRLLRGLAAAFQFTSAQQGRVGDLAVWKIEGGWRPEQLVKLLPKQKDKIQAGRPADLSGLAEHLPDRVVLLLGQKDLFPYRIDYCRDAAPTKDRFATTESGTLVTVEFLDVAFNAPIPAEQFTYSPPATIEKSDRTEEFLQSLGGK
jgi:hypothetical protein